MKKLILSTLIIIIILALPVWFLGGATATYARQMACPDHTEVTIDIKPGDRYNKNQKGNRFCVIKLLT